MKNVSRHLFGFNHRKKGTNWSLFFFHTFIEDEGSLGERSNSASQVTLTAAKKTTNEASTPVKTENFLSNSFQDIFATDNSEQAKDLIIN
ncbi:MAG: hypothetical protein IT247_09735, partial [Bacteroidia bacterium]|nr:hypothetical protein [Bacteroidia bacterium]